MAKKKMSAKREYLKSDRTIRKINKNKELYWIMGVMAVILAILIIAPYVFKNLNTFAYKEITFTKERYGEIPVFHYYYNFDDGRGQLYQYNLFLRNDPRENMVPVYGEIEFKKDNTVYISINQTDIIKCPNVLRDVASLTNFLKDNLLKVKAGTPSKEDAEFNNLKYITCENNANSTVILLQAGSETKIEGKNNCYLISVNKCELLNAVEKFEVQAILDAKARAAIVKDASFLPI